MSKGSMIPQDQREKWQKISDQLLAMHKIVMEWQFSETEKVRGPITNPNQRLNLLLNDDEFHWMRWMSRLVTNVHHILDYKKPLSQEQWLHHRTEWLTSFQQHFGDDFKKKIAQVSSSNAQLQKYHQEITSALEEYD